MKECKKKSDKPFAKYLFSEPKISMIEPVFEEFDCPLYALIVLTSKYSCISALLRLAKFLFVGFQMNSAYFELEPSYVFF